MAGALGNRRGFTLTELLVVVAIIVLLVSIVVPNITGRITKARMTRAEQDISAMEVALASYHADFGTYPGDVFPTEDINNDGVLDTTGGEDGGVDVDRDGTNDYATDPNGRLDHGDGVVNIDDLEWALRTTAKNGPYMDGIPLDPWGNKYVYYVPFTRPAYNNTNDANDQRDEDFLWIDPTDDDTPAESGPPVLPARTLCTEDVNANGRLDPGEDVGIADYDSQAGTGLAAGFTELRAGAGNGILDHGDDDNKNYDIETFINVDLTANPPEVPAELELGNADISPDGLSRNRGYYIYCVGRDEIDNTATGYEDINLNSQLNDGLGAHPPELDIDPATTFSEDIDNPDYVDPENLTLDTGYEDTGIDGIPGTKDASEDDGEEAPDRNEEFQGPRNDKDVDDDSFDIGGDDINSWNQKRPWRSNVSYGG